jgi:hypothetical protein
MGGNALDVCRVCERMAAIDLGLAASALAMFLGSDLITVGGTPEQKRQFMGYEQARDSPHEQAPIFDVCTRARPSDLLDVLPALAEQLREVSA